MFEIERLDHILAFLHEKPTATVKTLANRLYASEATVRRDLTELEKRGLVKRLHGGVVLLDGANRELPIAVREQQNVEAKREIAAKAAKYLRDGQVIFLDASSTVMFLIKYFESFKLLTIVTNGLKTAQELSGLNHNVYCTGGLMLHNSSAYVGDFAVDFVRHFNADVFFFFQPRRFGNGHDQRCVRRGDERAPRDVRAEPPAHLFKRPLQARQDLLLQFMFPEAGGRVDYGRRAAQIEPELPAARRHSLEAERCKKGGRNL